MKSLVSIYEQNMQFINRVAILLFVLSISGCSTASKGNPADSNSTPVNEISRVQDFFIHLQNGDETRVYFMFIPVIGGAEGKARLSQFVKQNGLLRLESWKLLQGSESREDNVAYDRHAIYEVTNSDAEKRIIGLSYDKPVVRFPANSTIVRLRSAYIPSEAPGALSSGGKYVYAPELPAGKELQELLKSTTLLFARSAEAFSDSLFARDFQEFTDSVSRKFVHQGSVHTIGYKYRYMYDKAADMHELSRTSELVITSAPRLREDGTFDVQFGFADNPNFGFVYQRFIHEGLGWKIVEIEYKEIDGE